MPIEVAGSPDIIRYGSEGGGTPAPYLPTTPAPLLKTATERVRVMVETYTKLDGTVYGLRSLPEEYRAYLERALDMYRAGAKSAKMHPVVWGTQNPVLELRPEVSQTAGFVTKEAYFTPLFQILRDLMDRVEIKENLVAAEPGDFVDEDPTADEWIPSAEAAKTLGISVPGLHKAIDAGRLISKPAKEGGRNQVVSRNSIRAYQLDETRRKNGRQGGRPVADS